MRLNTILLIGSVAVNAMGQTWPTNTAGTLMVNRNGLLVGSDLTNFPVANGFPLTVFSYGATNDGTTDATAYIQAALDTGRDIHFPRGTYKLSGVLTISNSNQRVTADAGATLVQTHTSANAITIQHATNVTVSGLKIQMPEVTLQYNNWGDLNTGIKVTNVSHSVIENCVIDPMCFTGIALQSVTDSTIRGNIVANCPLVNRGLDNHLYESVILSSDLLIWGDSVRNTITGNKFKSGGANGIFLTPVRYTLGGVTDTIGQIRISDNEVSDHTRYGICGYRSYTWTNINDNLGSVTVDGNRVFDIWGNQPGALQFNGVGGYGGGIFVAGWQDWVIHGNRLTNCTLYTESGNNQNAGIVVQWATRYQVTDNYLERCYRGGITIDNNGNTHTDQGSPSGLVANNTIHNTGWVTNGFTVAMGSRTVTFSTTNYTVGMSNITLVGAGEAGGVLITGLSNLVSGTTFETYHAAITGVTNGTARKYTDSAIILREASYSIIEGNNIVDAHSGGVNSFSGSHLTFRGNSIRQGDGFLANGYRLLNLADCIFDGNTSESAYAYGVSLANNCRRMILSNNKIIGAADAFLIDSTSTGLSFDHNITVSCTRGYNNQGSTNTISVSNPQSSGTTTPYDGYGMLLNVSSAGVPAVSNLVGSVWRRTDGTGAGEIQYLGYGGTNWVRQMVPLSGTDIWAPTIADNALGSKEVTVTGAQVGDTAWATYPMIDSGNDYSAYCFLSAIVQTNNIVTVNLLNKSGGSRTFSSGAVNVTVWH